MGVAWERLAATLRQGLAWEASGNRKPFGMALGVGWKVGGSRLGGHWEPRVSLVGNVDRTIAVAGNDWEATGSQLGVAWEVTACLFGGQWEWHQTLGTD